MDRIYLDNAATTWPKPESVYQAIDKMQRLVGAPAGRGAYREANEVHRLVAQTRQQLAGLINAPHQRNIVFTFSGTDSLCTAIFGLLKEGDHVVTSTAEHNSVLRPLRQLEDQQRISVTRVPCELDGRVQAAAVIDAVRPETRLIAVTHVSNVTGAIQPIEPIGDYCRQNQISLLVDAAQSLGHLPIDVQAMSCDILAAPGHKGLFGPLGTGVLYVSDGIASLMKPFRLGGTGSTGATDRQPEELPEKFESGNLNVPGIAGMQAGLEFLATDDAAEGAEMLDELAGRFLEGLLGISGIQVHGPVDLGRRVPIFSITLDAFPCVEAAGVLDSNWSIQTRAGFHCAPLLHRTIGTEAVGGTLRFSLGLFNTAQQIDLCLDALSQMIDI